jgi:hypothetical protein
MAQMVNCDVCGGLFSSSHLKSHKRLAHGRKQGPPTPAPLHDQDAMQMILALFDGLSPKNKKLLLKRLTSVESAHGT